MKVNKSISLYYSCTGFHVDVVQWNKIIVIMKSIQIDTKLFIIRLLQILLYIARTTMMMCCAYPSRMISYGNQ